MTQSTDVWRLAVAELAIFIVLLPIVVYILIRHKKNGFDGWGFLAVFCILRLTSSGIQVGRKDSVSSTGAIINSIGISGLLLAFAGIMHEVARVYHLCDAKRGTILSLFFHIMVVAGIVLAAIGGSRLTKPEDPDNDYTKDHNLQKGGYVVLIVAVFLVLACNFLLLIRLRSQRFRGARPGMWLLSFNLAATLFGIARVAYGLAAAVTHSRTLSPITGTFAIKFVMIFLVQLIAALLLIVGGVCSVNMQHEAKSLVQDARI